MDESRESKEESDWEESMDKEERSSSEFWVWHGCVKSPGCAGVGF